MATRNEVQIALDLVRFINCANDLMDSAAAMLQELDPQEGVKILKVEAPGSVRDWTFGELREQAQKMLQNVLNYESRVNTFVGSYGSVKANTALTGAFGMDLATVSAELSAIGTKAKSIISRLGATTTKEELDVLGKEIDKDIPKLELVRRTWRYIP